MFSKVRIKNFKCLQDTGDVNIRPLTFLVGPNSSGKTSFLQMLLMLRQTVDSTDMSTPLVTSGGWTEMGSYPEFIYKGERNRDLEINIEFSEPVPCDIEKKEKDVVLRKCSLKSIFSYNSKTTQIILRENEIKVDNIRQHVVHKTGRKYCANLYSVKEGVSDKHTFKNVIPERFYDFEPSRIGKKESRMLTERVDFFQDFYFLRHVIRNEFLDLFHLGPLRDIPKRFYVPSGQASRDIGRRGERAIDVFWFSSKSHRKDSKNLVKNVSYWFEKFGFAKKLHLDRIAKGNYYRVGMVDPATGVNTNLADVGFGVSQTLPIIIESFHTGSDSLLLLEQPEIHLHPKAQSILGDMFISAASSGRKFLIETHSEHMLARICRRIAENKIKKEDVAIYYFKPTAKGTKIKEVTLNEYGQYESFPKGFFEEDVVEAFEHLKSIKKRKKS